MNKGDLSNIERALKDFRLVIKSTPQLEIGDHVFFEGKIRQVVAMDAEQGSWPNPSVYRVALQDEPGIQSMIASPKTRFVVFQSKEDKP